MKRKPGRPAHKLTRRKPGRSAAAQGVSGEEILLRATRELLKHKGPEGLSRSEIAKFAGVDPALIRYHFGTTTHLLTAVATQLSAETHARMNAAEANACDTEDRIRRRLLAFLEIHSENPRLHQLMVHQILWGTKAPSQRARAVMVQDSVARLKTILDAGAERGELKTTDARFLHIAMIGMCAFFFWGRPVVHELFGDRANDAELAAEYGTFISSLVADALRLNADPAMPIVALQNVGDPT